MCCLVRIDVLAQSKQKFTQANYNWTYKTITLKVNLE